MISIDKIDIAFQTEKKKMKSRNGDFVLHDLVDNEYVILTLADGVSKSACDWYASQTACEKFIELCQQYKSTLGI